MRVLWVKAGGLVPPDAGGKIRSYNLLRQLARTHAITFFTYYAEHANDAHPDLEPLFANLVCRPLRIPAPRSVADYLSYGRNLFSTLPYAVAKYCRPSIAAELWQLARAERHDIIVCDFLTPAPLIPWEFPCPKVLFTHNVEATIFQRHYQLARNPLWKAACLREYRAMLGTERKYLSRADHVLTVSDVDRDFFSRIIDARKISVIPTGVDIDYFRPAPGEEQRSCLVFTGSMDWLPNEDGVIYFIKEILPRIRSQIPDVSLFVVGRRPSPRVQAIATQGKGIRVTGRVDDVRPYMRQGAVYIVPLRIGGGTRLKIFEAMAMGKAVVSTSIGVEGLPVEHGENILIADRPSEFANAVTALLRNQAQQLRLGAAARQLVEQKYSWPSVASHLESVLVELVEKKRPYKDSSSGRKPLEYQFGRG